MPKAAKRARGQVIPDRLAPDALTLSWTSEGGFDWVIDLREWPGSVPMRRQLLGAFEAKTRDDWRSLETVRGSVNRVRGVVWGLEQAGVTDFGEVTPAVLEAAFHAVAEERGWSETHAAGVNRAIAQVLPVIPGLPEQTRWWLRAPKGSQSLLNAPGRDYLTRDEFLAVQRAAERVVRKAWRRIQDGYADALAGGDLGSWRDYPAGSVERRQAVLHGFLVGEDAPSKDLRRLAVGMPGDTATGTATAINWLLPTPAEALAMAAVLVCHHGYNLSTVERLRVASTQAGATDEASYLTLAENKPRRGPRRQHSTAILEDDGTEVSAGSWVRRIEEATAPARHLLSVRGASTDLLLLSAAGHLGAGLGASADRDPMGRLLRHGVSSGAPKAPGTRAKSGWVPDGWALDFRSLHRTYQVVINRAPTHNTRRTHIEAYLLKNPEARAEAHRVAREGIQAGLDASHERVSMRLLSGDEVPTEVRDGSHDTATGACRDITQHPVTGAPCEDSFLACLACSNAVATHRHLPRLSAIYVCLDDLRASCTSTAWEQHREHYLRLFAFLVKEAGLDDEGIEEMARRATAADRRYAERLLRGDFDV